MSGLQPGAVQRTEPEPDTVPIPVQQETTIPSEQRTEPREP